MMDNGSDGSHAHPTGFPSALAKAETARLDKALAGNAANYKSALLRPFNTCAAYPAFARLPTLVEQVSFEPCTAAAWHGRVPLCRLM